MAKLSRPGVGTSITTNAPTNGVQAITAADMRQILNDINDSSLNLLTDLPNIVLVNQVSDFGTPVGGVYTLTPGSVYIVNGAVAMGTSRLTASGNVVIRGWGLGVSSLTGTPSGGPMITHTGSGLLYVKDLAIDPSASGQAWALSGTTSDNATFDSVRVVQQGSPSTIATRGVVYFDRSSFAAGPGFTVSGTVSALVLQSCGVVVSGSSQTGIAIQSTATISSRVRVESSTFSVASTCTGINVDVAATIGTEALQYTTCTFSGAGTYTAGVTSADNKAAWSLNRGISNSGRYGHLSMEANATATTISVAGTYVKVAGTTVLASESEKFTMPANNRLQYNGQTTIKAIVSAAVSMTCGNNKQLAVKVYKNGVALAGSRMLNTTDTTAGNAFIGSLVSVSLSNGDYIELWCTNLTDTTAVTAIDLQMDVAAVPA